MKRWLFVVAIAWIVFHLIAYLILPHFIPYLGFFPYKEVANSYHLPGFLTSLANFDGEHYILIAKNSYSQYEQAFFPLYPFIIRMGGMVLRQNYLLSAILISFCSFFTGLFFFRQYLKEAVIDRKDPFPIWKWTLLFILLFPTSFFFTAVYTEGLFFLLAISTLYFLRKKNYLLATALALLTSLNRLVGVFIFIPILFEIIEVYTTKYKTFSIQHVIKSNIHKLPVLLAPLVGLGSYCLYLFITTGDALFFLHAQSAFGANRSSDLIFLPRVIYRYIMIFLHADKSFLYFVSGIEFSIFLFVFIVLCVDFVKVWKNKTAYHFYSRISLNIFSFINLLLPTFTGTLSSIPRYALMSFSFFIFLGEMKNTTLKVSLLTIFALLHILLFGFFVQGYFVS